MEGQPVSPSCDAGDWRDVQASLDGDETAYGRLVDRHQQAIGRYARRFTRNDADWEVLVQDVFVEAYCSLHTFRGAGSFGQWLRSIATRVGYRYWRQRSRDRQQVSLSAAADVLAVAQPDAVEPREAAELVHHLLAQLPPRDRLVLTLSYIEQLPMEEVARLTGWSYTMAKVQAHRARQKLKRLLEKMGEHG